MTYRSPQQATAYLVEVQTGYGKQCKYFCEVDCHLIQSIRNIIV